MRDRSAVMPVAFDRDGIAAAQQLADAGNLALAGALTSGGVYTAAHVGGSLVALYSAGNLSAVNFTVTGTKPDGSAESEVIAGPNAQQKLGAKYFKTITQIAADAAVGSDVEIGNGYPLIVLSPTQRGRVVDIRAAISSLKVAGTTLAVLAIDIPAALWATGRAFRFAGTCLFAANGNNKNPQLLLGATTIRNFGTAAAQSPTNDLGFDGEILRAGASSQRSTFSFLWGGLVDIRTINTATENDGATVRLKMFLNAATADADATLDAFTLDILNTP